MLYVYININIMINCKLIILPTTLFDYKYVKNVIKKYSIKEIIIWEHPYYFTRLNFNKKKLILHRASMKYYQNTLPNTLLNLVDKVTYLDFNKQLTINNSVAFDPVDEIDCPIIKKTKLLESPGFLLTTNQLKLYREKTINNKRIIFGNFYKFNKKLLNIIPDIKSQDKHNRKKLPKSTIIKDFPKLNNENSLIVINAIKYINKHFRKNVGDVRNFNYPINKQQANLVLKHFLKNYFDNFGNYQDYTKKDNGILFHTILSSSINIGLITPKQIIDKLPNKPLNSYEGLIRQYFWREYQRYCYIYRNHWIKNDFFKNKKSINDKYYLGTTNCPPVDDAIKDAFSTGYLHHIRRLMIMANYMNLDGIKPYDAKRWFMEFAIDSYEWVMYQNVLDMGFFISGGMTMRKPYITSSNYIIQNSDYSKGEWSIKWDNMYKEFLTKHKKKLYPFRYHFPFLRTI